MNWFEEKFLRERKPYCWLVLIGFVVYFQSLFFGFTYFDDNVLILDNLFYLQNIGNIFKSFTLEVFHVLHASAAYYRPLLTISYMIDAQFSGPNPFFYHFSSVAIHVVNACLLFVLLGRLKMKKAPAFLFSIIFVIHPILTQAVSWIPGRNDSLLALFVIPSFIYFIDYLETKKNKSFLLHLGFFAACLFTKESSIFIPPLFAFYALISCKQKDLTKDIPKYLFSYLSVFVLWFLLRGIALAKSPIPYTASSSLKAILQNLPATLLYIGKIFLPFNLTVLPTLQDSSLMYGLIATPIFLLLIILFGRKNIWLTLFGFSWFFVFLVPSFIRPSSAYVADFIEHRSYVPIIGIFIILGNLSAVNKIDLKKPIHLGLIFFILSLLMALNLIHNRVFRNRIAFWQDAVKHSPRHPLAHKNMGAMYYLDGQIDKAEIEFKKSVDLNPSEAMIHNNLGLIYLYKRDYVTAEKEFYKELELYPSYDNAHANLGLLYYLIGKKELARDWWLKTIAVNPDHKDALKNLALYYNEIKDVRNAQYYYNEAVKRGVSF